MVITKSCATFAPRVLICSFTTACSRKCYQYFKSMVRCGQCSKHISSTSPNILLTRGIGTLASMQHMCVNVHTSIVSSGTVAVYPADTTYRMQSLHLHMRGTLNALFDLETFCEVWNSVVSCVDVGSGRGPMCPMNIRISVLFGSSLCGTACGSGERCGSTLELWILMRRRPRFTPYLGLGFRVYGAGSGVVESQGAEHAYACDFRTWRTSTDPRLRAPLLMPEARMRDETV